MYKFFGKDYGRYINAGNNQFYRWGRKTIEKLRSALVPNEAGFYNLPADGRDYWTIGTSDGKFGEFAKLDGVCFSVNKAGNLWCRVGSDKEDVYVKFINSIIEAMQNVHRQDGRENGYEYMIAGYSAD